MTAPGTAVPNVTNMVPAADTVPMPPVTQQRRSPFTVVPATGRNTLAPYFPLNYDPNQMSCDKTPTYTDLSREPWGGNPEVKGQSFEFVTGVVLPWFRSPTEASYELVRPESKLVAAAQKGNRRNWQRRNLLSDGGTPASHVMVDWTVHVRRVLSYLPTSTPNNREPWSDKLCKAVVQGISLFEVFIRDQQKQNSDGTYSLRQRAKDITQLGSGFVDYCMQECLNRSNQMQQSRPSNGEFVLNWWYAERLKAPEVQQQLHACSEELTEWLREQIAHNIKDDNLGDMIEGGVMFMWAQEDYKTISELLIKVLPPHCLSRAYDNKIRYLGSWNDMFPVPNEPRDKFAVSWQDSTGNSVSIEQLRGNINEAKQKALDRLDQTTASSCIKSFATSME